MSEDYEPIGTLPEEGDSVAHVAGNYHDREPDATIFPLVGYDIAADEWLGLSRMRWSRAPFLAGRFRIVKRPEA